MSRAIFYYPDAQKDGGVRAAIVYRVFHRNYDEKIEGVHRVKGKVSFFNLYSIII
jgi:hypothetical protein